MGSFLLKYKMGGGYQVYNNYNKEPMNLSLRRLQIIE